MQAPQPQGRQNQSRLMSIGAFARRSRLSARALRLYERQGLLIPAEVDEDNGYRYYLHQQLDTARLIALLRRLDMPLSQVAEVIASPPERGSDLVGAYWAAVERRNASQGELARHVQARLSGDVPQLGRNRVCQRVVPEQTFLTQRHYVRIGELATRVAEAGPRLKAVADGCAARAGEFTFLYHGEVTEDSDGPVEFCLPVDAAAATRAGLVTRTEPAHREAFVRLVRAEAEYPQILSAYDAVFHWVDRQRKQYAGAPREVYLREYPDALPDQELCDVALPFL